MNLAHPSTTFEDLCVCLAGWLAGWLVGWLFGVLDGPSDQLVMDSCPFAAAQPTKLMESKTVEGTAQQTLQTHTQQTG